MRREDAEEIYGTPWDRWIREELYEWLHTLEVSDIESDPSGVTVMLAHHFLGKINSAKVREYVRDTPAVTWALDAIGRGYPNPEKRVVQYIDSFLFLR